MMVPSPMNPSVGRASRLPPSARPTVDRLVRSRWRVCRAGETPALLYGGRGSGVPGAQKIGEFALRSSPRLRHGETKGVRSPKIARPAKTLKAAHRHGHPLKSSATNPLAEKTGRTNVTL